MLVKTTPNTVFLVTDSDKNTRSSVAKFVRWLDDNGLSWANADLKAYLDYLNALNPPLLQSTIKKHMERVRARYKDMQHSNTVRDMIQAQIPATADAANAYAVTEEFLTRIRNNTQYDKRLEVKLTQRTTYTDDKFRWLTREEVDDLFKRIPATKQGARDAAIFGLCLSYGLREAEACAVTVADMNKFVKGIAGVEVRHGKGDKQRFVQRDPLTDYTGYIQAWLEIAGITEGLVLEGLKERQLQNRVKVYTTARPHDLRRTYAKLLHAGERSVEYIAQQLGHSQISTTLIYLGLISR